MTNIIKFIIVDNKGEIIFYRAKDGHATIEVKLENNTVWLNQYQMADLFETDRPSLAKHIKNIYKSKELLKDATCAKIAQVRNESDRTIRRNIEHYNLNLIISVGYRVNSHRGTQFRIWANEILKEYLVKGYAINEKRLRSNPASWKN